MKHQNKIGQVTIEYFLILAAVVLVTLVSLATLDNDVATTFENLFTQFAARVTTDGDAAGPPPPEEEPPEPLPPPDQIP